MATVSEGQSFLDMVIQTTGDMRNLFTMAVANGVGITDELAAGTEIKPAGRINRVVVGLFNEKKKTATNYNNHTEFSDEFSDEFN